MQVVDYNAFLNLYLNRLIGNGKQRAQAGTDGGVRMEARRAETHSGSVHDSRKRSGTPEKAKAVGPRGVTCHSMYHWNSLVRSLTRMV